MDRTLTFRNSHTDRERAERGNVSLTLNYWNLVAAPRLESSLALPEHQVKTLHQTFVANFESWCNLRTL